MNLKQIAEDNLILKIMVGSHMYGTNTEESDKDYVGVCIPPKDFVLGTYKFEQYEERTNPSNSDQRNTKADSDLTIYALQKYIKLLADNNPNILETVFAPESCVLFCNELGRELLNHRHIFLSRRAYYKYGGYASAQKQKLIRKKPSGLRSKLVEKYGYDVKYAAHLIRLLLFGIELLQTGNLALPAARKRYILSVKNGEWPLSVILKKATLLESELEAAYQHSCLPEAPDVEAINKLQISLIENHWKEYTNATNS